MIERCNLIALHLQMCNLATARASGNGSADWRRVAPSRYVRRRLRCSFKMKFTAVVPFSQRALYVCVSCARSSYGCAATQLMIGPSERLRGVRRASSPCSLMCSEDDGAQSQSETKLSTKPASIRLADVLRVRYMADNRAIMLTDARWSETVGEWSEWCGGVEQAHHVV